MDENLKNQKEEMVDRIKEEFKDDPLFIECSLNHLTKGQLFPDFLGERNFTHIRVFHFRYY